MPSIPSIIFPDRYTNYKKFEKVIKILLDKKRTTPTIPKVPQYLHASFNNFVNKRLYQGSKSLFRCFFLIGFQNNYNFNLTGNDDSDKL